MVVIAVIIVSVFFGGYYYTQQMKADSYESEYAYEVNVDTDSVQSNVTLYVPFLRKDGDPVVTENSFINEANIPKGWSVFYVETQHGLMLSIFIDQLEPDQYKDIYLTIYSDSSIDTRNVLENEPILSPVYNITEEEYNEPHPEEWDERLNYYEYETYIFCENVTINSNLEVSIELTGSNTWWVFGWSGNEYRSRAYLSIENAGWHNVDCGLVEGWGNY